MPNVAVPVRRSQILCSGSGAQHENSRAAGQWEEKEEEAVDLLHCTCSHGEKTTAAAHETGT